MWSIMLLLSANVFAANIILKNSHLASAQVNKNHTKLPSHPSDNKGSYIVQKGDTLFSIARIHGTSHAKIIEESQLDGGVIKVGQELKIPTNVVESNTKVEVKKDIKSNNKVNIQNIKGWHIVSSGETLFGVARQYGVGPIDLATENNVDLTYMLKIGEKIKIPLDNNIVIAENDVPRKASNDMYVGKVREKMSSRKINCDLAFGWPVYSTSVIYGYGETMNNGTKLDGVVIASSAKKNIIASYSGEVAYAGEDIPEYGKLMIIKHKGNWMTVYGYIDQFTKKVGDKVVKGDLIGIVGQTGDADGPSLYFSIRKVKKPYNPELCI